MTYQPRIIDQELRSVLSYAGAVLIEGPKACGKTETARQVCASEALLDVDLNLRAALDVDPSLVLDGAQPRLIDEWQVEPSIWNHVRRAVDDRHGAPGAFVLTGSAVPADDITRHTGAGRISRVRMRPMSLFELEHSLGTVSLAALFGGSPARAVDPGLGVADLADIITIGGWPAMRGLTPEQAARGNRDYLDDVRRTDVQRVDDTRRDPERVGRVIRALARSTSTMVSARTLAADAGTDGEPLSRDVTRAYLDALTRLMVIEDQPAWAPHLRSKSIAREAPKRHFADPALAAAALGATPERMLKDLNMMGFLFESLVVRDLRIYAQSLGGRVLHYRDNTDLEVDAIVELPDGTWAAFEIKLGQGQIDAAAASLTKFVDRIDTIKSGPPAALGVITATGYGVQRADGINVIPIGSLGP